MKRVRKHVVAAKSYKETLVNYVVADRLQKVLQ